ncbi:MAG: ATP-binding protein [Nocardioides sp.]
MPESAAADDIRVSVPARLPSLDLVQPALERLWQTHEEVPLRERMRLETAVVEIFVNIVQHAYRADSAQQDARRLELVLAADEAGLEATFVDNGEPAEIDLSRVTMPDSDSESGRGLAMAIAALDDLRYERTGGRNRWHLLVRLPATG